MVKADADLMANCRQGFLKCGSFLPPPGDRSRGTAHAQ